MLQKADEVKMIQTLFLFLINTLWSFPSDISLKADTSPIPKGYGLYAGKELIGEVKRRYLSLSTEYDFYASELKARATKELFQFGVLFKLSNEAGELLGKIEERIYRILPTFDLFSPTGEKLIEGELDFWGTEYTFKDPLTGTIIATLSRPYFRATDDWTAKILKPDLLHSRGIDSQLFYLVLGLQGDYQHWASYPKIPSNKGAKIANNRALTNLNLTAGDLGSMEEVSALREMIYTHPAYVHE